MIKSSQQTIKLRKKDALTKKKILINNTGHIKLFFGHKLKFDVLIAWISSYKYKINLLRLKEKAYS